LGLAGLGFSLELQAAKTVPSSQPVVENSTPRGPVSNQALWNEAAHRVAGQNLPVLPPQVVNWKKDLPTQMREAGLLTGPLPLSTFMNVAACTPPNCSFDIECEDGNPCTVDTCNLDPEMGLCSGMCANTAVAAGEPGECGDGIFCNGEEVCPNCVAPGPATCCDSGPAGTQDPLDTACTEVLGRCDGGPADGRRCVTDTRKKRK
jgi:hypothetical protein